MINKHERTYGKVSQWVNSHKHKTSTLENNHNIISNICRKGFHKRQSSGKYPMN